MVSVALAIEHIQRDVGTFVCVLMLDFTLIYFGILDSARIFLLNPCPCSHSSSRYLQPFLCHCQYEPNHSSGEIISRLCMFLIAEKTQSHRPCLKIQKEKVNHQSLPSQSNQNQTGDKKTYSIPISYILW